MKGIRLKAGDLVLTKPAFQDWKAKVIGWFNKGLTHVGVYLGKGRIIDCDEDGLAIRRLASFFKKRESRLIKVYVLRPTKAVNTEKLLLHARAFAKKKISYSKKHILRLWLWLKREKLYLVKDVEGIAEFCSYAVCSTFAAFLLRQSGAFIGKRASITFFPRTFVHSRHFRKVVRFWLVV